MYLVDLVVFGGAAELALLIELRQLQIPPVQILPKHDKNKQNCTKLNDLINEHNLYFARNFLFFGTRRRRRSRGRRATQRPPGARDFGTLQKPKPTKT